MSIPLDELGNPIGEPTVRDGLAFDRFGNCIGPASVLDADPATEESPAPAKE